MPAPGLCMFTFESTVHPSRVLRCLEEQRQNDTLCDITVVVEGQSFRAHRSVLSSCSEYFYHRISSLSQRGAVMVAPQEVTVAGFEPLLTFAYTSKLLFSKDNVFEIQNSASILGFKDLDEACFDFLLPKFFPNTTRAVPFQRKTCCKKTCKRRSSNEDYVTDSDEVLLKDEVKPVSDSPFQQEASCHANKSVNNRKLSPGSVTPVADSQSERPTDCFTQCPKYRKFQLACGKESLNFTTAVIKDGCDIFQVPCSNSTNKNETKDEFPEASFSDAWKIQICDRKTEKEVGSKEADQDNRETDKREEKLGTDLVKTEKKMEPLSFSQFTDRSAFKEVALGLKTEIGARLQESPLPYCNQKVFGDGSAITAPLSQETFLTDSTEEKKMGESDMASIYQKTEAQTKSKCTEMDPGEERGKVEEMVENAERNGKEVTSVEREVAENLSTRLGADLCSPLLAFADPDAGSSSDTASKQEQDILSCTKSSCLCLQVVNRSTTAVLSESEGASQSSLNSGEDGDSDTETEGDSESYTRERARQVQLPYSVEWVVNLSRNDFQQLLKQQVFTHEQLDVVHDMRRRSKNRLAAQRCRKRKLECIYNLQCEINKLKTEREKLMLEKSQLSQLKSKTCHSVSTLCQRVCSEANLQPEQLQVLAKYASSECPMTTFFPHIDSVLNQHEGPIQAQASVSACSEDSDQCTASRSSRDTKNSQHSST
ncbi:transcription regulator protein BACH1b [Thalassophryne amazonica]|uniref:transcription regulator protein BACH1b n=1 Tax=Thalassophryne amazonica TaxID=390379 RepID=UPI001470D15B|nr:transcription regulator protein BACH1b [Thalassophryne amazonica]